VKANFLAVKKFSRKSGIPQNAGKGEVLNIAAGKDYTILELVNFLNKIMGKNIKPIFLPPRPGDVFKTQADISRAKKRLGFKPKINFKEGLELTIEWFKKNA
jgi:UDP-glucose 4-epimerase